MLLSSTSSAQRFPGWMKGNSPTKPEGPTCNCALCYGKFAFGTKHLQHTEPAIFSETNQNSRVSIRIDCIVVIHQLFPSFCTLVELRNNFPYGHKVTLMYYSKIHGLVSYFNAPLNPHIPVTGDSGL